MILEKKLQMLRTNLFIIYIYGEFQDLEMLYSISFTYNEIYSSQYVKLGKTENSIKVNE